MKCSSVRSEACWKSSGTMWVACGRIPCSGCTRDSNQLVCEDDGVLGSLARCLADSNRELHSGCRSPFVAGNFDCKRCKVRTEINFISSAVNLPFLYTNVTFSLALIRTTAVTLISVSLVFTRISEIRFINNSEGESSDVISPFPSIAFVTTVRIHSLWRCWRSAGSTRRTSTVLVPFLVSTRKTKDNSRLSQEIRLSGLTLIRR